MRYLTCALIFVAWAQAAAAQQSAGDIYATAGVSFPRQAALDPGSAPPFPAPGGHTVGWLVGGGIFLWPQLALEGELSRTGTMQGSRLRGRHDTSELATRRDWFLSFGVKGSLGPSNFRIEPVAGIVLVGDEGTYEKSLGPSSYLGYYPLDWVPGVMFGVDFRIGGRRVAITPGLRFAFTSVPTGRDCIINFSGEPACREGAERWQYRHPQWTQRPSVALRVDF